MGAEADSVTVAVRFTLPFLIAIPIGLVWFSKLEKLEASYRDLLRKTNELMTAAGTDPLTGLRNRRSFTEQFDVARAHGVGGTFLIADVDYLKQINDQYGHLAGDDAILAASAAITKVLGDEALIARIGGDEFCAFLPNRSLREIDDLSVRINSIAGEDFRRRSGLEEATVTLSIGHQLCKPGQSFRDLISQSDRSLYKKKRLRGGGMAPTRFAA